MLPSLPQLRLACAVAMDRPVGGCSNLTKPGVEASPKKLGSLIVHLGGQILSADEHGTSAGTTRLRTTRDPLVAGDRVIVDGGWHSSSR
jgi:hypothetical protein